MNAVGVAIIVICACGFIIGYVVGFMHGELSERWRRKGS